MSDESKGLTKWQVAVAVGVGAVAVVGVSALAYVALSRSSKPKGGGDPADRPVADGEVVVPNSEPASGAKPSTGTKAKSMLDQALAIKQQGNEFFKKQDYDEAIRCYEEGIRICPLEEKEEIAKFHQNIAASYDKMASNTSDKAAQSSHLEKVVEHCSRALEYNHRYVRALTRRLKAFDSLGRKKEALLDVTRVIILDESQSASLGENVANLLKDISKEQAALQFPKLGPLTPTKYIVKTYIDSFIWHDDLSEERLKELWRSSKPQESQQGADSTEADQEEASPDQSEPSEESHDLYEGFSDDPFVRAAAAYRNEQYHGIIETLTEAVETGCPVFLPHALLLRGTMYVLWRQNELAVKDFTDVINTKGIANDVAINVLIKKATVYAGDADMEKVKGLFDKCFVLDSNCPDALIHRGRMNLESASAPQDLELALEDLQRALNKVPDSAYATFSLATAYHRMAGATQSEQLLAQATAKFEEAATKFPTFSDGMVLYAMYLQDMGQFVKAKELLEKAKLQDPDNSTVHFSLGILYLVYERDPDKAVVAMEKAISVDNSCIQAYDTLASVEMQRNNVARALELYDKAVQFSRSQVEMGQALVAREVISAQTQVCAEYNISMKELTSRAMSSAPFR